MVARWKISGHHGNLVRQCLQIVAIGADEFKYIRILFMRHDAAARSEVLGKRNKIKVLAEIETTIHRQFIQRSSDATDGHGQQFFCFTSAGLRINGVPVQSAKTQ